MGRRAVGLVSAGLGGAALAVAVLMPAGSPLPVVELPHEAYETVAVGADVAFLDPVTLERRLEDVSVTVRARPDADSSPAESDTAVWVYDTTTRAADGSLVATTTTTACVDRRTAEAADCVFEAVDGRPTDVRGLAIHFPPATPEQDLKLWDGTAQVPYAARFAGSERLRGLEVQRYETVVPEQVVRTVTVPGALVGSAEQTTPADVVYSGARALLVEPVTGVVVSTDEIRLMTLRAPDGTGGAVLLGGAFGSSEESVTSAVARVRLILDRREISGDVVPWVAGGAGLVLLALGAYLLARSRSLPAEGTADDAPRQLVPIA